MEGNGCKSYIELNNPDWKTSLSLLSYNFDFTTFNINSIPKDAIVILDFDSFVDEKILFLVQKMTLLGIKTIIYSQLSTPGLILKAKQQLVSGYISKHSNPEYLLNCINVLELGGLYYDPIFSDLLKTISTFEKDLSLTQKSVYYEVLASSNKGLKEIAARLNLSKHNVEVHLSNIYQKAGVSNFQELISCFSL